MYLSIHCRRCIKNEAETEDQDKMGLVVYKLVCSFSKRFYIMQQNNVFYTYSFLAS